MRRETGEPASRDCGYCPNLAVHEAKTFSKSLRNLRDALALHVARYNFVRIHGSLRVAPAMAAGVMDHVWGIHRLLH